MGYLAKRVIIVAHRVHIWVRLLRTLLPQQTALHSLHKKARPREEAFWSVTMFCGQNVSCLLHRVWWVTKSNAIACIVSIWRWEGLWNPWPTTWREISYIWHWAFCHNLWLLGGTLFSSNPGPTSTLKQAKSSWTLPFLLHYSPSPFNYYSPPLRSFFLLPNDPLPVSWLLRYSVLSTQI